MSIVQDCKVKNFIAILISAFFHQKVMETVNRTFTPDMSECTLKARRETINIQVVEQISCHQVDLFYLTSLSTQMHRFSKENDVDCC